jgi:ribosome-associated toxin RatA of RatAB toxin-antitoxin module
MPENPISANAKWSFSPAGLHNMVMLNIYFNIISGFIFEAFTQVLEKLVTHFVTVFRFCPPIESRRFDLRIKNL